MRLLLQDVLGTNMIFMCDFHRGTILNFCSHRGYTGPGGYHESSKYLNCTGGAAGYIDRIILSTNHMYQYPTIKHIYESLPFEPEGILSTTCFRDTYSLK